jgi:hypothetical protein
VAATVSTGARVVRILATVRCLGAAVLIARPDAVGRAVCGSETVPAAWIIRLLGARLLGQGAAELGWPTRTVVLGGSLVDATHGASMVAATALFPSYRRAAVASAAVAGVSAALGAAVSGALG